MAINFSNIISFYTFFIYISLTKLSPIFTIIEISIVTKEITVFGVMTIKIRKSRKYFTTFINFQIKYSYTKMS